MRKGRYFIIFVFLVCFSLFWINKTGWAEEQICVCTPHSLKAVMSQIAAVFSQKRAKNFHFDFNDNNWASKKDQEKVRCDILVVDSTLLGAQKVEDACPGGRALSRGLFKDTFVIATQKDNPRPPFHNLQEFVDSVFDYFIMPDPQKDKEGQLIKKVLVQAGFWEGLKSKVIAVPDHEEALHQLEQGKAEFGIVYYSDTVSSQLRPLLEMKPHLTVWVKAFLCGGNRSSKMTKEFFDFLTTKDAKHIFQKYGFVFNRDIFSP